MRTKVSGKSQKKKLELSKETLRRLSQRDLMVIVGGQPCQACTEDSGCCTLPRTGTC